MVHSPQTCGETVVIGYHHGGVQGLEIQNQNWVCIEFRFRFQNQRKTLWGCHSNSHTNTKFNNFYWSHKFDLCLSPCPLLDAGRDGYKVCWFCQPQHHGLHPILGASVHNALKLYPIETGKFTCPTNQIEALKQLVVALTTNQVVLHHPMPRYMHHRGDF